MRFLLLFLVIFLPSLRAAEPPAPSRVEGFEIREGDRVLLLGDTLLERENTYGYLETRMHEQFPDRHFTVRNLSWAGDTPRGVSRASFDGPDKGWERLKESIALVQPTVVFLGYGMAASLQEMTDRAQDITLNRDETRYGSEPMSAARFKKELGELMDAIGKITAEKTEHAENAEKKKDSVSDSSVSSASSASSAVKRTVRFVLLSPIRHEDLRAVKPGLPDPAPHNALLEQYSKAIEELAKEKGARFVDYSPFRLSGPMREVIEGGLKEFTGTPAERRVMEEAARAAWLTDNGIHLNESGYDSIFANVAFFDLGWIPRAEKQLGRDPDGVFSGFADMMRIYHRGAPQREGVDIGGPEYLERERVFETLRAAVLKKNELFFHRFRPENATYLFGFRKHEQGQNAKEIPMFDPLIEQAEAEIDKIKRAKSASIDPVEGREGGLQRMAALEAVGNGQKAPGSPSLPTAESPHLPAVSPTLTCVEASRQSGAALTASREALVASAVSPHLPAVSPTLTCGEASPQSEAALTPSREALLASAVSPLRTEVNPITPSGGGFSSEGAGLVRKRGLRLENETASPDQREASPQRGLPSSPSRGALLLAQNAAPVPASTPVPAPATPPPLPDFTVQDGYQIALWAENPLLEKPTQMNWDALGRLWVCSSSLYPQIEPGQPANDKILILEDTDGDGKADKSTIFADGLLIPTAVVPDLVATQQPGGLKAISPGQRPGSPVQNGTRPEGAQEAAKPSPAPAGAGSADDLKPRVSPGANGFQPSGLSASACYVGQSTELLYFQDTDGDGKADTKRVVFSGFGTEDTHHIVHTLKWGPDGRLYFNQSIYIHTHLETPWGMVRLNSAGVFAYDPRTERVEVLFKGLCNPWGLAWDQWGQAFMTDGAGGGGINWGIPGAMYFTYENGRRIAPSISPGSYPKFCSLEMIHSPMFPADWQGNAVTNDFRAHRIVRFSIEDLATGPEPKSGYVTKEQPDLVRTSDQSFRPIDVRHGPDGALYVADWSNPVINHGEVDFRDPRRDHHMGRIWRISKKDTPPVKWEPLVGKDNRELMGKLLSKSAWEQQQARAVAGSRLSAQPVGSVAMAQDILKWDGGEDIATLNAASLEKAWLMCRIGFNMGGEGYDRSRPYRQTVEPLFSSREPLYRAQVARLLTTSLVPTAAAMEPFFKKQNAESDAFWKKKLAEAAGDQKKLDEIKRGLETFDGGLGEMRPDELPFTVSLLIREKNPRVRLEAMRALARIPTAESAVLVLEAALNSPGEAGAINARGEEKGGQFDKPTFSDTKDPYYGYAAWLSINDLAKPWTDAIASGAWQADTTERQQQLAWGLKNIDPALASATLSRLVTENKVPLDGTGPWIELLGQAGGAKEIDRLWARVQEKKIEETTTPRILAALTEAALLRNVRPTQPVDALANYLDSGHAQTIRTATRLAGAWKMESTVPRLVALTAGQDDATRNYAFEALRGIGSEPARAALRQLAAAPNAPPIRGQAVAALAALDLNTSLTFDALAAQPAEEAALNVWRGVLGVKDAADKLAASIPKEMPKPVALAGLRAAREAGKNGAKLLAALTPLAGMTDAEAKMPKDFKALAGFAKQNGDPARGELIYRRMALACTTCHAIGGAGGKVGPDMTSLGASAPLDYIIESVIAPALKVKEGYNAVTLALKDGTQATGIQARETAQEVFLRDVVGKEQAIAKAQITGTTNVGSIMPAGMTDALPDRERLDLFAFLGELGKPGPYDASKGTVARVWKLFSGADAAKVIGSETPMDAGFAGYTLVDGRFVKELLEATAPLVTNGADTLMAVTQFQSTGKTRLKLTGAGKVWLDGKPLALSDDLAPDLSAGVHTLAVKLDMRTLPEYLRAESPDARFLGN